MLGIGIEINAASSGISAASFSAPWYRSTGFPYSVTKLLPASAFLFIPVPDAVKSDIPAFEALCDGGEGYTLHVCSILLAVERDTRYTLHVCFADGGK
jgi:hypothetical protein